MKPAMYCSGDRPISRVMPPEHGADPAEPARRRGVPDRGDGDGDTGQAGADPQPRDGADPVADDRGELRVERDRVVGDAEDDLGREAGAHQRGDRGEQQAAGRDVGEQAAGRRLGARAGVAVRPRRRAAGRPRRSSRSAGPAAAARSRRAGRGSGPRRRRTSRCRRRRSAATPGCRRRRRVRRRRRRTPRRGWWWARPGAAGRRAAPGGGGHGVLLGSGTVRPQARPPGVPVVRAGVPNRRAAVSAGVPRWRAWTSGSAS